MATANKTQPTTTDVASFIEAIQDASRRDEIRLLVEMLTKLLNEKPVIWGTSIIGFGEFAYKGKSGRSGTWMRVGLASRKDAITFYLSFYIEKYKSLLERLGPHKTGVGCLYVKRLADIDLEVLKELILQTRGSY